MKKHHARHGRTGYVGFLDYRPHVQQGAGARTLTVYLSRAAARRAYEDVRTVRLVFDAEDAHARAAAPEEKP
jgi:hypothetical protein